MLLQILGIILGVTLLYFVYIDINSREAYLRLNAKFKFKKNPIGYLLVVGFKLVLAIILLVYSISYFIAML
mgnify:CR=1